MADVLQQHYVLKALVGLRLQHSKNLRLGKAIASGLLYSALDGLASRFEPLILITYNR